MPTITEIQSRLHLLLDEPLVSITECRRETSKLRSIPDRELLALMPTRERGTRWCRDALVAMWNAPGLPAGYTAHAFAYDVITMLCAAKSRREASKRAWGLSFALPADAEMRTLEACPITGAEYLAQAIARLFTDSALFAQAETLTVCSATGTALLGFSGGRDARFKGPAFDPQRGIRDLRVMAVPRLAPIVGALDAKRERQP